MRSIKNTLYIAACIVVIWLFYPLVVDAQSPIITGCPSLKEANPHIYVWRLLYGNGVVEDVPFNDYIIGVVEGEIFPNAGDPEDPDGFGEWDPEVLKAQATAVRTFAISNCGMTVAGPNGSVPSIADTQQAYRPDINANYESLRSFVSQGFHLAPLTNVNLAIDAQYRSYNHDPNTFKTLNTNPNGPLKGIYDRVSAVNEHASDGSGAGPGFAQNSGDHWARGVSHNVRFPKWDYTKILAHYYTNVQLVNSNGAIWGAYRWNLLQLNPSSNGEIYYEGQTKRLTLRVQNTGTNNWESGTTLRYCWQRVSTASTTCSSLYTASTTIPSLAPGSDAELAPFLVTPPIILSLMRMGNILLVPSSGLCSRHWPIVWRVWGCCIYYEVHHHTFFAAGGG